MTTLESRPEDQVDNDQKPCGHGRMLRKEDPRFIRGRGNYVDDVSLPGMLHLAILRSPYAHARIVGIDTTAAQAHPKVKAVVTGADLAEKGLAWMPTLSNDVQAVLATDKVRFQGQEVAFVVAEDHYSARDALELIDVDYDPLDPVDRCQARARRVDSGDPDRPRGQDRQPLLRLGDRRRGRHRSRVREGRRGREAGDRLPARASRADGNLRRGGRSGSGHGQAHAVVHQPGAARAPYALRVGRRSARAQDPGDLARYRRRIRQQGADLSRLRVRDRRLAAARQAGQVDGGPQRELDQHQLRPRLHHGRGNRRHQRRQDPGDPVQRARRPRRVQRHRRAGEVPGRLLRRLHRQLRHRGRLLPHDRGVHQQGARRCRLRVLVPDHRSGVLRGTARRLSGLRAEDGPGRASPFKPVEARPVSVQVQDRLGLRLGRLRDHHAQGHGHDRLRRIARRAEARSARAAN